MSEYSADDITHLEGLDAVRKRPGMYIGSTDSRGLVHLLYEIFDNSVDEALAGHCTKIDVVLHGDGSVEVADNGRGIPVDINKKSGKSGLELCLTELHAGGKFGGKAFAVSGGLHGVGASVTNALSSRLDATVFRDGKVHEMSFQRGVPGVFDSADADAKFTKKAGLRSGGAAPKGHTGTTIRFWPDRAVFMPDATIDPQLVFDRAQRTAFLVPGLTVEVTAGDKVESFCYSGGLVDMVEHMNSGAPLSTPFLISGTGSFTENVPVLDDNGHMSMQEVVRSVDVEVAFQYNNGYEPNNRSFVNIVSTPLGGTHQKGFEQGLVKWVRDNASLKAKDEPPVAGDCLEGLTAVVSVKFPEPQFEGQTKEILGTKPVQAIVSEVTQKGLTTWANARGNKPAVKTVLDKIVMAARIRVTSKEQRDTQRRKTALESGNNFPAKLVDCRSRDNSELLIVEGDSALGTARAGRDSTHQALLPIRGKIINTHKATVKQALDNAEVAAIIQCIGAGSGRSFNLDDMRYARIIMLADADVDGSHIRTLLITLFAKFMRPIIEDGRLYTAVPPLHHIKTTGKSKEEFFTYTAEEMERKVAELEASGKNVLKPVQRFKGLGEMSAEELRATTLDPRGRTLRRITIQDVEAAEKSLELLMGSEVAPRRDHIVANANTVEVDY